MSKVRQILIANTTALVGCALLLAIIPGSTSSAVWLVPVILSLGLVNAAYWLLPHLAENKMRHHGQALLTLALILLAGLISWVWIRH